MHNRNVFDTFGNAFSGLIYAFKTQKNIRFHTFAAIIVIIAALLFHITKAEWVAVSIAITLVVSGELINTAIEAVVDMYTQDYHPLAKAAKDVAAAAVVVCAVCSVFIGVLVFLPYVINLLH